MNNIVLRDGPGVDGIRVSWRDSRRITEARTQTRLAKFWEYAEADRLETRIRCGRRLADVAADELVAQHHYITDRAAGDPALELDLRDFQRVVKRGCERLLDYYLSGRW